MFPDTTFKQYLLDKLSQGNIPYSCNIKKNSKGETFRFLKVEPQQSHSLVVYLHGTGDDIFYPGSLFISHLIQNNCAVLSFDLDGHGRNSTTKLSSKSFKSFLLDKWTWIREEAKGRKIFLLGHSLGGTLALSTALSNDLNVHGVIGVGSPFNFKTPSPLNMLKEIYQSLSPEFATNLGKFSPKTLLPAIGPFKRDEFPIRLDRSFHPKENYVEVVQKIILELTPSSCKPSHIPVLLVLGAQDSIAPLSDALKWLDFYPEGHHIILQRTTHFLLAFRQETATQLIRWINKEVRKT